MSKRRCLEAGVSGQTSQLVRLIDVPLADRLPWLMLKRHLFSVVVQCLRPREVAILLSTGRAIGSTVGPAGFHVPRLVLDRRSVAACDKGAGGSCHGLLCQLGGQSTDLRIGPDVCVSDADWYRIWPLIHSSLPALRSIHLTVDAVHTDDILTHLVSRGSLGSITLLLKQSPWWSTSEVAVMRAGTRLTRRLLRRQQFHRAVALTHLVLGSVVFSPKAAAHVFREAHGALAQLCVLDWACPHLSRVAEAILTGCPQLHDLTWRYAATEYRDTLWEGGTWSRLCKQHPRAAGTQWTRVVFDARTMGPRPWHPDDVAPFLSARLTVLELKGQADGSWGAAVSLAMFRDQWLVQATNLQRLALPLFEPHSGPGEPTLLSVPDALAAVGLYLHHLYHLSLGNLDGGSSGTSSLSVAVAMDLFRACPQLSQLEDGGYSLPVPMESPAWIAFVAEPQWRQRWTHLDIGVDFTHSAALATMLTASSVWRHVRVRSASSAPIGAAVADHVLGCPQLESCRLFVNELGTKATLDALLCQLRRLAVSIALLEPQIAATEIDISTDHAWLQQHQVDDWAVQTLRWEQLAPVPLRGRDLVALGRPQRSGQVSLGQLVVVCDDAAIEWLARGVKAYYEPHLISQEDGVGRVRVGFWLTRDSALRLAHRISGSTKAPELRTRHIVSRYAERRWSQFWQYFADPWSIGGEHVVAVWVQWCWT